MIYDYIVVGSGFGGSVSALRLAEKGYSVLVIEQGKRYNPADFPKSVFVPKGASRDDGGARPELPRGVSLCPLTS